MSNQNFVNIPLILNQKTLVNPVDISGNRIKSGSNKDQITTIKNNTIDITDTSSNFVIIDSTKTYLDIDTSNNIMNFGTPININKMIFSNEELIIQDISDNNYLGFNSMTKKINFYQSTNIDGPTGPTGYTGPQGIPGTISNTYSPNNPSYWANTPPNTVQEALDRLCSKIYTSSGNTPIP